MQSTSPIDCDIALSSVQTRRALHGATSTDPAELEQAVKDGTVISDVVFALLFGEVVHVVRCDFVEELDIFVGVELRHFVLGGWFRALRRISYGVYVPSEQFRVRRSPFWCRVHNS
jgi:hypothetical protein